ncbi:MULTISPECIES: PDDEXK nuclease domain-containing protein [Prevotellaceae]|uniref:PDDEXK nuclease domain-containing protein n=1 Tax=Prevotellaceae TaxID=171552 RepID=UPI002795AC60|nr:MULTISPECIES: PDDEXK nuclease domain-containing protein [Prevotellaceae]
MTSIKKKEYEYAQYTTHIGIIICKSKSRTIVEYALKTSAMPIGVATYSLSPELPEAYKELLSTSEDIAKKLEVLIKE